MRAELAARIAFQEGIVATWSSSANRPAAIEATARAHTGNAWFDVAVCRVLLGEGGPAAAAFAQAVGAYHSTREVVPVPSLATYSAALESAVLSGDTALAANIAADPVGPEPRPSLVEDRLAWALALPALVTGDGGAVKPHADAASAVPDNKAWYPGLGAAVGALASGDGGGLNAALERVLAKHVTYARGRKSWCYNAGPCLLCVPATVLVRLARTQGLAVGELAGRRATVPLAMVHAAPGETVEIEADFVPELLTA